MKKASLGPSDSWEFWEGDKEAASLFLACTQKWKQFLKGRDPENRDYSERYPAPETVFGVQQMLVFPEPVDVT